MTDDETDQTARPTNLGQIIKKAVYIAIGIKMDGVRDVLGMW